MKLGYLAVFTVWLSFFSFTSELKAQKVGVVLSGGGASGMAHIGVLKALEESEIPIDYITGTSMGALVGGLYAAGYSPDEIQALFHTPEFKLWTSGQIDSRYVHYFKRNQDDASWIRIKFTLDSLFERNLPTSIVNNTSLDFGMAELFSGASARAGDDFDNLFVPFRCMASDISSKRAYMFKDGHLPLAVRASISYPFYLNPVNVDGKLLYDGGLYDNFPVSTMCEEFEPEYIIGSNVSYNFPEPQEDNVLSQIRSMMSYDTDYHIHCEDGFIIEPEVSDIGVLDFSEIDVIVEQGYQEALKKIDSIRLYLDVKKSMEQLKEERNEFKQGVPELVINNLEITGLSKGEQSYVRRTLRLKEGENIEFNDIEAKVMRLASDEKIKYIQPSLIYNKDAKAYTLRLKVKKEKKLFVSFGGNISTLAVNEGFVGLQFNELGSTPMTLYGNSYFGRFYTSGYAVFKLDIPTAIPFQIYGSGTYNKLDYFQNSSVLLEQNVKPSSLIQVENFGEAGFNFPISYKGKLGLLASYGDLEYEYYQNDDFTRFDTTDITHFINTTTQAYYERSSLNRKQYANKGSYFLIKGSYTQGEETYKPGSTSSPDSSGEFNRRWYRVKLRYDKYFNPKRKFKYGGMLELVYSDQPFFSNYTSTILAAPGFTPTPESQVIFRSKYRAHQYGAVGLRGIYSPIKNFDFRLEGFMFQPLQEIIRNDINMAEYTTTGADRYFIGSFTMLYDFSFTQLAINVNYYDNFNEEFSTNKPENYTIMLHLGYVLFNRRMLD